MFKTPRAVAWTVGVFLAVAAVVVGTTLAISAAGHRGQAQTASSSHSSLVPASDVHPGSHHASGGMLSQIPDTSLALQNEALRARPGVMVAHGHQFTIEKVPFGKTVTVDVRGQMISTDTVYRITITDGPYQVMDMPAVVSLGTRPLAIADESPDLSSLTAFTFDKSVLSQGATLRVSYGLPSQAKTVWTSQIEVAQ